MALLELDPDQLLSTTRAVRPSGPARRRPSHRTRCSPPRAGGRVEEVFQRDGDDQVRLDRAQEREPTRGELVVGKLDQGVGELLGVRARIPGGGRAAWTIASSEAG